MLAELIHGLILGCILAIYIGPVFVLMSTTTLHAGRNKGVLVAIGAGLSDLIIITPLLIYIDCVSIINFNSWPFRLATAIVLMLFGFFKLIRSKNPTSTPGTNHTNLWSGFVMNILNPGTIAFWAAAILGIQGLSGRDSEFSVPLAIYIALATALVVDLLKVFLIDKTRTLLPPSFTDKIETICGMALVIWGIVVLIKLMFQQELL